MTTLTLFLTRTALRIQKNKRIRFDYLVMILGITVSVLIVSTAIDLFEGYQQTLKKIMLDTSSHIMVYPDTKPLLTVSETSTLIKQLAGQPEIESVHPVYANAVIARNGDRIRSSFIRAYQATDKTDFWFEHYSGNGHIDLIPGSVIVGDKLARDLALGIGNKITLLYTKTDAISPLGIMPLQKEFMISSIIKTGYFELDKTLIIMPVIDAYSFFQIMPQYTYMEVNLKDKWIDKTAIVTQQLQSRLGRGYQLKNWIDFNGNLFSLITMEKWLIFLVFSMLILIASLNCVSTVTTAILDRKKEIAILKTIGVTLSQIKQVVYLRILFLCLGSIVLGLILGSVTAWLITQQSIYQLKGDVYFIDKITTQISPVNYLAIGVCSILLVSVCIMLPLRYLNKFEIIDILRGN